MHKVSKNLEVTLKFQTPVMWHEGSSTLRSHQYQGTAAQNIVPPGDLPTMICAPLLLLKTIFKHNSMHRMLLVHRTGTGKVISIRQQVLIQMVQNCAEFSAHRWTLSLRNYEKRPPPTWLIVGPVCWPPSIMITLSLWVTECRMGVCSYDVQKPQCWTPITCGRSTHTT